MSSKTTILRVPLINELTMLIACSKHESTIDEVGDIAHICPHCQAQNSTPFMEIIQHGMFDHDSVVLVMYCGRCFRGAIWTYDIPHRNEKGN